MFNDPVFLNGAHSSKNLRTYRVILGYQPPELLISIISYNYFVLILLTFFVRIFLIKALQKGGLFDHHFILLFQLYTIIRHVYTIFERAYYM